MVIPCKPTIATYLMTYLMYRKGCGEASCGGVGWVAVAGYVWMESL